jgi:hypothetical protein
LSCRVRNGCSVWLSLGPAGVLGSAMRWRFPVLTVLAVVVLAGGGTVADALAGVAAGAGETGKSRLALQLAEERSLPGCLAARRGWAGDEKGVRE